MIHNTTLKNIFWMVLLSFMAGCTQHDQAVEIIEYFTQNKAGDLRENVFAIEPEKAGIRKIILHGETDNPALKDKLIDSLTSKGISITDSIAILPVANEHAWGIVNISTANLRAKPYHRAELVSQALMGTPVKILKKTRNWSFIQTPDKYLSWIENAAFHPLSEQQLSHWQKTQKVIITSPFVLLTDSLTKLAVSDVVMGCILEVSSSSSNSLQVQLPDGRKAMIASEHVQDFEEWKHTAKPGAENLLATAHQMKGVPYLWGGTSNKGIDCSGYTKTIYFMNGIILARDASLQAKHGEHIPVGKDSDLYQTGDLLFFSARAEKDSPIIHVAMYMNDNKFIHASGMVRINSLNPEDDDYDESNTSRLASARRIMGKENTPGIIPVKNHPWY